MGLLLLLTACSGPTRVRLILRVEEERFRSDYAEVIWGLVDGPKRSAPVPANGKLAATGTELGSVLAVTSKRFQNNV